ncbi:MAG: hypothetical protein WCF54_14715 [Terracidiphilus sp.]
MTYTLSAFDYELIVGETARRTWTGGYRERGSKGSYIAVGEFPDGDTAKLETCKAVQALAGQMGDTVLDPCKESLGAWSVE